MLLGEFAREQARDVVLAAIDLLEAAEFQQGNDGWRFSIVAPRANPSDKLMGVRTGALPETLKDGGGLGGSSMSGF